ncbi:subtilisin-like protease SBT1.8 [Chenopodium quinoa]|uniref:subtilisin-like protease SBT1.8 n=1 Tax=Chenopodium quinoa TaxID=63459 RepID=UPI000B79320F|nr:subtilisin-like protease SBT1.8 [Chenopodium quinoa]
MASKLKICFFLFPLFLLQCYPLMANSSLFRKTYIVHMNYHQKPESFNTHHEWYSFNLNSLSSETLSSSESSSSSSSSSPSLLYSYSEAYSGYAATLTASEAEALRKNDAVFGVYEDTVYTLHTTRTPEFLGLDVAGEGLTAGDHLDASDVIVGVLDTGIWPESKSFDDTGMPPVPKRWKGVCESGPEFPRSACNNKLIGARSFSHGYKMASGGVMNSDDVVSPRDTDGHGTHTASTVAGGHVANASLLGYASGTARGMAPRARVAAYKVCFKTGCFGSDILGGIDKAISDGVDVLSLSLGGGSAPYFRDTIAIGAFSAIEKGIFVSCSAGNSGPTRASLANTAPWIMTVGAGTLDRNFPAFAVLGNGKKFTGVSLYSGKGMGRTTRSLYYGGNGRRNGSSNLCMPGSLDSSLVKGKVVLCDRGVNARVEKGEVVKEAGGVGMILANTAASGEELVADSHLLPAVAVGMKMGDEIREYVRSAGNKATAVLSFGGTVLNVRPSPVVAAFSSRGPNMVTPQIMKPDVIGPGVNILAAWSEIAGPTGLEKDTRKTQFNIMSGTSMSCPHISGLAALLKAAHPEWSPSAIKSALMTTAYNHDNMLKPLRDATDGSLSNPWAHGAGHVDPHKALNPGLVYDISIDDYVTFLCALDYTPLHRQIIAKRPNITCSRKLADPGDLNYPSFSVLFGKSRTIRYTRELTNVGAARTLYQVHVDAPPTVGVKVRPSRLLFRSVGEKKKYTVIFIARKGKTAPTTKSAFGSLLWTSKTYQVRSPVSFTWSPAM